MERAPFEKDLETGKDLRPDDRLTTADAAEYLSVAYESLKRSRCSGLLRSRPAPAFIKEGHRYVRYFRSTLDTWMAASEEYPSSAAYKLHNRPESATHAD